MRFFSSLAALGRNLFQRKRVERDLAEEVDSYLALSAAAKNRAGLDVETARRAAAVELGGIEQVKEQVREARLGYFLDRRWQDLRFAWRTLRKAPVFSLTVVLVLALGIGSTALIFTIVNATLVQGPPFPESSRLFMLWGKIPQESEVSFSPKEFTAWQKPVTCRPGAPPRSIPSAHFATSDRGWKNSRVRSRNIAAPSSVI